MNVRRVRTVEGGFADLPAAVVAEEDREEEWSLEEARDDGGRPDVELRGQAMVDADPDTGWVIVSCGGLLAQLRAHGTRQDAHLRLHLRRRASRNA
jgi:hypothetical protein